MCMRTGVGAGAGLTAGVGSADTGVGAGERVGTDGTDGVGAERTHGLPAFLESGSLGMHVVPLKHWNGRPPLQNPTGE